MPKIHRFSVSPEMPSSLLGLEELALNLRWTWDPEAYRVFQDLDPETLERCRGNPAQLLRRTSPEHLKRAAADKAYRGRLDDAIADLRRYLAEPGWFRLEHPDRDDLTVAYFCMEYGVTACLPIYAGGLGVLAGDHLKSASGLDLPLVAVGLLYSRGYFTQRLDEEGWQYEEYHAQDFGALPIRPVMVGETWTRAGLPGATDDAPGDAPANEAAPPSGAAPAPGAAPEAAPTARELLKVAVDMAGRTVWARVWEAKVGRISLYLLDSAVPENDQAAQRITDALYSGGSEDRLAQELLLGIGGTRALRALGVRPDVVHLNEGHSVFATLERIREVMHENGLTYHEARQATGGGTLFTTHTPVSAGFDVFREELIETYLAPYLGELSLDTARFMDMGRAHRHMPDEEFNVAVLALRQAPRRNAVSRLHRRTTAGMMEPGWPDFPRAEMPIESVTNGVHTLSWVAREMAQLYDTYLDPGWRYAISAPETWQKVEHIPDEELWRAHVILREHLVAYAREQARVRAHGVPLRGDALTIGFARRFATYKRATLLLRDLPRLKALLLDEQRPVQLILAGKAHPADGAGKDFIREILDTVSAEGLGDHVVFIEDYDLSKAAYLVQGADVWLSTPMRPMEASGTSGMKVLANGGLNCSVLDGWWAEGYRPGVGWAIGDGQEFAHSGYQDEVDSESLYSLLEREVVPLFYERDAGGVPRGWVAMMKRSIEVLVPAFSGERMVKEYTEEFYLPVGSRYRRLAADGFAKAKELNAWKFRVRDAWGDVRVTWVDGQDVIQVTAGEAIEVTAKVQLGCLDPSEVTVEAYASSLRPDGALRDGHGVPLEWVSCEDGEQVYRGSLSTRLSGEHGFAVRVLPRNEDVLVPNELPLIAWEQA
jgi:starch phosphorylase